MTIEGDVNNIDKTKKNQKIKQTGLFIVELINRCEGILPWIIIIWIFFGILRATNIRNSIIAENRKDAATMNLDTVLPSVSSVCLKKTFGECLTLPSPKKSKVMSILDPYAKDDTYIITVTPDSVQ